MEVKPFISVKDQVSTLGNHRWSVARLHALSRNLPVMEIPIDHLNVSYVYDRLTLREMVMHMKAVNNADLGYPIILDEDGFDENPDPCRVVEGAK